MTKSVFNLSNYESILSEQKNIENVISAIGMKSGNLSLLANNGIKIPQSFCIKTNVYDNFKGNNQTDISDELWQQILDEVKVIEEKTGKKLGSKENPLLLAVRCDATAEVAGILSNVLYIGFNDLTARALETITRNRAFAYNCYSRFICSFAKVALGISETIFENLISQFMKFRGLKSYSDFTAVEWIEITKLFKSVVMKRTGLPFTQDPLLQLRQSISGILRGCNSERLQKYRQVFHLTNNFGFSVLVQECVFGNINENSFSAVISTRNPVTGGPDVSGIFCMNSVPSDIKEGMCNGKPFAALEGRNNQAINDIAKKVEQIFKSPQTIDIVHDGKEYYIIDAKPVMFSGSARFAAVRDMTNAGLITKESALMCLTPEDLNALSGLVIEKEPRTYLAHGTPAGAGVVVGKIVLDPKELYKASKNLPVFFKNHITPNDFNDILAASAVITSDEGTSSYTARILRLLRKPAILDAKFEINYEEKAIKFGEKTYKAGDTVSVGATGKLFPKAQKTGPQRHSSSSASSTVLGWADSIRNGKMLVLSAANTAEELDESRKHGADGLSYFAMDTLIKEKRVDVIKTYAEKGSEKAFPTLQKALASEMAPILRTGKATIMLFSNPLSSYYPNPCQLTEEIAVLTAQKEHKEANDEEFKKEKDLTSKTSQLEAIKKVAEQNPLLGVHGVRMNIINPPLLKLQMGAILLAAREAGQSEVRVLLPSVMFGGEVAEVREISKYLISENGIKVLFGASIDTARGCLAAGEIAAESDFIALSTTLLQATGFGMSKVDAEKSFLRPYIDGGVLSGSPFACVDDDGIGELMAEAVKEIRSVKENMDINVYGDQCDDARSIKFCSSIGARSVTCPLRMIPVAKLCCAQAVISSN